MNVKLEPIQLENNLGKDINGVEHRVPWLAYDKDEADAVLKGKQELIAEKDKEIARLEAIRKVHVEAISSMEAGLHQDGKEIRRLKRALFIALAYKAKYKKYWYCELLNQEGSKIRPDNNKAMKYNAIIKICQKCDVKCRAMAEQYK